MATTAGHADGPVPRRGPTATAAAGLWRTGSAVVVGAMIRTMRVPGDFPLSLRSRPFTRAEALAAGVSASRLRSRDVERVARGVHRWIGPVTGAAAPVPAPITELDRLQALAAAHPDVVVTGESAARLWGWPLPDEVRDRVRPTVLRGRTRRVLKDPGVRTRLVDMERVVVRRDRLHGLRWASHGDAWFHLAVELDRDALVAVGDRLVRSHERRGIVPLAAPRHLRAALERHAGEVGIGRAREALALVREGADSPAETELRLALLGAGLPEPDLQIELWDPAYSSRHPASADLGYRRWRIALHYEGKTHDGAVQVGRDTRRDAVFLRRDWLNIRVAGTDRARGFVERVGLVRAAVAARAGVDGAGNPLRF